MATLQDMADEYEMCIIYHNQLITNIGHEFKFYSGVNPLEEMKRMRDRADYLKSVLPPSILCEEVCMEWTPELRAELPEDLRNAWDLVDKQIAKINDFSKNYHYLQEHYPNFNVKMFLFTTFDLLMKQYKSFLKKGGVDKGQELSNLEEKVKSIQKKKVTSAKVLQNHKSFEELKAKYPDQNFNRELSQAEKDLQQVHKITKVDGFDIKSM